MTTPSRILITGATGELGLRVADALLKRIPAAQIIGSTRNPGSEKAKSLAAKGIEIRRGDYGDPASLASAFSGAERTLLISSNAIGERIAQHQNAVDAAKAARISFVAYTSLLHAGTSPLALKAEHVATEAMLAASGLPCAILRNGWYTENYLLRAIPFALDHGIFAGCAGNGLTSSASREDFAEAAAAVLTSSEDQAGKIYELAGDEPYTLTQFANWLAEASGKPVVYKDLPEADYKALLLQAGLPEIFAELLANSDSGAKKGGLFDGSKTLSKLIGRPTTPPLETVRAALKALALPA